MNVDRYSAPMKERILLKYQVYLFTAINTSIKAAFHDVAVLGLIPHAAPKACNTGVDDPSVFVKLGLHGAEAPLIAGLSLSPLFQKIFST